MNLLPDRSKCGLPMSRKCRERFPRHRGLAIPTCITARARFHLKFHWSLFLGGQLTIFQNWFGSTRHIFNGTYSWWHHKMETLSALLAICAGNSPVTGEFPHKGQWREALMLSLMCAWVLNWVNNGKAGGLKRHRVHYDVTVMCWW